MDNWRTEEQLNLSWNAKYIPAKFTDSYKRSVMWSCIPACIQQKKCNFYIFIFIFIFSHLYFFFVGPR